MYKLKFSIAILIVICFTFLIISSCKKLDSQMKESTNNQLEFRDKDSPTVVSKDDISNARIEFGSILFKALKQDAQLASYLKQKMNDEYNSHYSFLYIQERNQIVYSGKTFDELLIQYSGKSLNNLNEIVCKDPLLTISMSDQENVSVLNWDNILPSIAAIKESDEDKYVLYNDNNLLGEEKSMAPSTPTINIIDSEIFYLVDSDGNTNKGQNIDEFMPKGSNISSIVNCQNFINSISNTNQNTYNICGKSFKLFEHDVLLQMYIDCFGLNTTNSIVNSDPCNFPCKRDCEWVDESLVDFRILNWGVYKAIANKFWETKFIFHGKILAAKYYANGTAIPHEATFVSPIRKKGDLLNCNGVCSGIWQKANYRIWTDWDQSNFGSPYYIDWSEEDNGTQTVGIAFPFAAKFKIGAFEVSAGVTPSISQSSSSTVKIGNAPVFYCDPIYLVNNTGSLEFRCN